MDVHVIEYAISQQEIDRRVKAFTVFIISLMLGAVLASFRFVFDAPQILATGLTSFLLVFLLFRTLVLRFFQLFLQTKIYLTDRYVEKKAMRLREKVFLTDIKKIDMRKTARGEVREIKIVLKSGRNVFFDGLENFNQFREKLLAKRGNGVVVYESTERIDYDHPLFYCILGVLVGLAIVNVIRLIANLENAGMQIVYAGFAAYVLILGVYFIFGTPLFVRYGGKTRMTDFVLGLLLVGAGACLYLLGR